MALKYFIYYVKYKVAVFEKLWIYQNILSTKYQIFIEMQIIIKLVQHDFSQKTYKKDGEQVVLRCRPLQNLQSQLKTA